MDEKKFDNLPSLGELMAESMISFTELRDKSGVARSSLEDIVYGKTKLPRGKTMQDIAKVFGLEPKQIKEFALAIELRKQQLGKELPLIVLEAQGQRMAVCVGALTATYNYNFSSLF